MTVMFHRSVSLEVVVGTVVDFARGRGRDGNAPDPSVPVVVWETAPSSGPYRCCLVGIKHFGTCYSGRTIYLVTLWTKLRVSA